MRSFRKNAKNPILGVLGQKGRFWTIFGQKGAIFEFSEKKRKNVTFLLIFFFIFQYKKSENSNSRIFGKMGTNVRTNERTYGGESKGPSTTSRDQKWKTIKLQNAILEALYISEIDLKT